MSYDTERDSVALRGTQESI